MKICVDRVNARRFAAAVALALAASASVLAAPARASVAGPISPGESTYDRPSIVNLYSGTEEIAWAGTDANGRVNYAEINSSGAIQGTPYTDTSSSTYPGTGVAINYYPSTYAPSLDFEVIAWTDLNSRVHVGLISNGVRCESTDFGYSVDTPSLTFAANSADQSEGINLYLVTVDASSVMHVTEVQDNGCATLDTGPTGGANTLTPGPSTAISGQTTWDGPTLLDTTPNSSPTLYLAWAGTNSAHDINIGGFAFGASSTGLTSHIVESNHATTTDLGNSYGSAGTLFTYCGTNNAVYGQVFNGGSTEPSEISLGGNCAIYTGSGGYVNGGVDVTYDGSGGGYLYLYPTVSSQALTLGKYS
jgi:hypothetical protein